MSQEALLPFAALVGIAVGSVSIGAIFVIRHRARRLLEELAHDVEMRLMPYLIRQAAMLHVDFVPPLRRRNPADVIREACALAVVLHDVEREREDMALGPTQMLPPLPVPSHEPSPSKR